MSNSYAQWDDGPYQQPPRPPERPSFVQWIRMSELERQAYEAGIAAYLMAQGNEDWRRLLLDMQRFYQTWWYQEAAQDANWKRGGR